MMFLTTSRGGLHLTGQGDHRILNSFKYNFLLAESVNTTNTMAAVTLTFVFCHIADRYISYDFLDLRFLVLHRCSPFVGFIYKDIYETSPYIHSSLQQRYHLLSWDVLYVVLVSCFSCPTKMIIYIFQVAMNKLHHRRTNIAKVICLTP